MQLGQLDDFVNHLLVGPYPVLPDVGVIQPTGFDRVFPGAPDPYRGRMHARIIGRIVICIQRFGPFFFQDVLNHHLRLPIFLKHG
ncbi:hypothetical protein SDC9_175795 [bioreactor metagenome]|uniref:Uncharacterized protein n=1 Tax=bioreactor metagenome TaxID=1076179 RepID=A0A645GWE7_9ZZZZ